MFSVQDKTALVTGGGQGIGRAIAEALASQGANIIISGRTEPVLQEAVREMRSMGKGRIEYVVFDVRDSSSIARGKNAIEDFGMGLHILVNNAGVNLRAPLEEMEEEMWDTVIQTNLTGVFKVSKAMLPLLKQNKGAKIINISSLMAEVSRRTIAPYCAAKGGIRQLTKAMANEWSVYDIQVNAIAPGYIATKLNTALMQDKELGDYLGKRIPANRWGDPKDVGACAVFLSSPGADYITGQTIVVDGGLLINV